MKLRKAAAVLLAVITVITGCTGCSYKTHYHAIACVHSNTDSNASLSFYEMSGTMVFRLKLKDRPMSEIKYTASLEKGEATIYYDYSGKKAELFTIKGGDELDASGGYIEKGRVYIIVALGDSCENGSFEFSID